MSSNAEEHVLYQYANARVRQYPFAHLYVEDIFPADFYASLRSNWPDARNFVSLGATGRVSGGAYAERFIMPLVPARVAELSESKRAFWAGMASWMLSGRFLTAMLDPFEDCARRRFGDTLGDVDLSHEVLVVRDHTNYKLGPHTDAPHKVLSVLFYCPDDDTKQHLGTSIYRPIDPSFRCPGGPHHPHASFRKVKTMPYKPNSLFAFFKNDHSFHGVDPIGDADVLRDLMLYDIRVA